METKRKGRVFADCPIGGARYQCEAERRYNPPIEFEYEGRHRRLSRLRFTFTRNGIDQPWRFAGVEASMKQGKKSPASYTHTEVALLDILPVRQEMESMRKAVERDAPRGAK